MLIAREQVLMETGREEGRKEGREQERLFLTKKLLQKEDPVTVARLLDIPLEDVLKIQDCSI